MTDQTEPEKATAPPAPDPKAALSARMARFKALQEQRTSGKKATEKEVIEEKKRNEGKPEELEKAKRLQERAEFKLLKADDPDFERKRHWDYTAEEDENWAKRLAKKARNRDNNAFSDYRQEANKVYKRQIKQLSKVDLEAYAAQRAEKLQRQVAAGLLELVETDDGDVFTVDKDGRVNTPVEENYNFDHKPSKEAVDRLVEQLDKSERARLKARAARGLKEDDGGDVTYINQKNKQFNEKLARFYNKYTTEIRESFERGTAI
ncbi:pre-mRNA splicing factor syf2 [Westerdykella ornata]|uniref:Pre-mRNA-splicing factor SYF2 n=1 Tax=Westerdykella ornata TaxID=318751 RepID=A0A6A6JU93_WESOR|nr:pre-mRNA splicing factor syf2 [Westerdykella ornata]KAF2279815.1 pre-mRNA splicing factor syf2 [Westerdykella ornata]